MDLQTRTTPAVALPEDPLERVDAGVLGKLIGVHLGRPFEQWTHQRLMAEPGPNEGFVHERLGQPWSSPTTWPAPSPSCGRSTTRAARRT